MKTILWISGWASKLSEQKSYFESFIPNAEHKFLDFPEIISEEKIKQFLSENPNSKIFAWSLGGLNLLRFAKNLPLKNRSITLVGTPLQFTHPEFGTPLRILQRMQMQLLKNPQIILSQFAVRMGISKNLQNQWTSSAMNTSTEVLIHGLKQLETNLSDSFTIDPSVKLSVFLGESDQIVPALQSKLYAMTAPNWHLKILKDTPHWITHPNWKHVILEQLSVKDGL